MASVTSLDKDLRNLRLSRYTPQAAAEVRDWIEEVLHESLPAGDLLEALKDGVALCRLVNLAVSPGVKFKQSSMPFVQMENISHFLRACQIQPLSLPPHDVFLTVDLYEGKDPAQVLQCLMAFSRRANAIQPSKFPRTIGPQNKGGTLSPNMTGSSQGAYTPTKSRFYNGVSDTASNVSAQSSPSAKSPAVTSWSKKTDEHSTAPAWNIHQYGYMGGASQANQGVAFGARRQITTAAPHVPSLAEKEKRRREEEDRLRAEQEHAERMRQLEREEREADEERARAEEARRWEEETAQLREKERLEVEQQRRQWDEEQRKWEEEECQRQREERETEDRIDKERQRRREVNDTRLNGQFLSQYQASQPVSGRAAATEPSENQRIRQLELELESAKERETQYERERRALREKDSTGSSNNTPPARSPRPVPVPPKPSYDLSSLEQERRLLRTEWQDHQREEPIAESSPPPMPPRRPLPDPTSTASSGGPPPKPPRPLPDPVNQKQESRVDRFLSFNRPPVAAKPAAHRPQDYSTTSEVDAENSRREAAQQKTKAGGWASKSLLEREMAVTPMDQSSDYHSASILCLQFDEEIMVTGSSDFSCIVWDIHNDYKPVRRLEGHRAGVLDVCFDERYIVSCSKDTTICVWNRQTGALVKRLVGHRGPVNAVQLRGDLVVSASGDGVAKLWNITSGLCIKEFPSKDRGLACVEFSDDARTILTGGNDQVIYQFDANTGELVNELKGHVGLVRSLHLDSMSQRIVSGSYDVSVKVFDAQTGELSIDLPGWTTSWMLSVKSDYRRIVATSQDSRAVIMDFGYGLDGIELLEE